MNDELLVSIDAETPLGEVVKIASLDIARRMTEFNLTSMPLETKDVRALCDWGSLLNSISKDHSKLFEQRMGKLGLGEIENHLGSHPVLEQVKKVAADKKERAK